MWGNSSPDLRLLKRRLKRLRWNLIQAEWRPCTLSFNRLSMKLERSLIKSASQAGQAKTILTAQIDSEAQKWSIKDSSKSRCSRWWQSWNKNRSGRRSEKRTSKKRLKLSLLSNKNCKKKWIVFCSLIKCEKSQFSPNRTELCRRKPPSFKRRGT